MTTKETLEAAIDEHPDQAGNYLVLADHLQEIGDPRGEWIVRWKAADKGDRNYIIKQLESTIGPPPQHSHEWFYGFIRKARLRADEDERDEAAEYLDHPSLRHATEIEIDSPGGYYDEEPQWIADLVAARERPCLRELSIRSYVRGGNEPARGNIDVSALFKALPRLRALEVSARYIDVQIVSAPALESLVLDGEVTEGHLEPLLAGAAPKLHTLELHDIDAAFAKKLAESSFGKALTKLVAHPRDAQTAERYEQVGE